MLTELVSIVLENAYQLSKELMVKKIEYTAKMREGIGRRASKQSLLSL